MNEELKEWLGIAPADFLVYAAAGAVAGMYYSNDTPLDVVLSLVAGVLCILSCVVGMKTDPRMSRFSNRVKRISYPGCLLVVVLCIILNFTRWNSGT